MTVFLVGDTVQVQLPRGYSKRGVLGISVLYTTSPESRFEGATGGITQINPHGPHSVHQYLVDFRGVDNSRLGIPWQAQWFREEWLTLVKGGDIGRDRSKSSAASSGQAGAEASESPTAAGAGPGRIEQSPQQEEQESARLDAADSGSGESVPAATDGSTSLVDPVHSGEETPADDAERPVSVDAPSSTDREEFVSAGAAAMLPGTGFLSWPDDVEETASSRSSRQLGPTSPGIPARPEGAAATVDERDADADTLEDLLALDRAAESSESPESASESDSPNR